VEHGFTPGVGTGRPDIFFLPDAVLLTRRKTATQAPPISILAVKDWGPPKVRQKKKYFPRPFSQSTEFASAILVNG